MNIFEELAENYTYNGTVSIKAIEDDIVTIENQIDSYNITLRELNIRKKNTSLLSSKIHDAKVRLSLLKALLKKERDKNTSNDVILSMLGISANDAKEVEMPQTIASGMKPLEQNFAKAELEKQVDERNDSDAVLLDDAQDNDSKCIEVNEEVENEEIVKCEEETSENACVIDKNDEKCLEETVFVNKCEPFYDKGLPITLEMNTEDDNDESVRELIEDKEEQTEAIKDEISNDAEYRTFDGSYIQKENDMGSIPANDKDDEGMDSVPMPTEDDYLEPVRPVSYAEEDEMYAGRIFVSENEAEIDYDAVENVVAHDDLCEMDAINYDLPDEQEDFLCMNPFYDEKGEFYASFDLSDVVDMVNTDSVNGIYDNNKKIIDIYFSDLRDYDIFVKLTGELENKRYWFRRVFKKRKSIFMHVFERIGESLYSYCYEFTKCRVKETHDTEYSNKRENTEDMTHKCMVSFKYKRLILNKTECHSRYQEKETLKE